MDENKLELIQPREMEIPISFSRAWIRITPVGRDIHILFGGGDRPHIGCTVMAVPRSSLTGDGSVSVTFSVINVTGHKDEAVCRMLAEEFCRRYNCTAVCTGGFHVDGITAEQIAELMEAVRNV